MRTFLTRYGLFILIASIALFLRAYNLPTLPPGLYPDEAMNGNNGLEAIATGDYKIFYPENNGREGLFINLQALAIRFTGINEPWVLRSLSVFFGFFTVIGVYAFVTQLLRQNPRARHIALIAMFFVATSFWHINFSRIGFRAIMAPMFLIWGLYFLIKMLGLIYDRQQKTDNENVGDKNSTTRTIHHTLRSMLYAIAGGILYGLGMHSYIAYRATPIIILATIALFIWIYKVSLKRIVIPLALYGITALIIFLPLGIYFINHPEDFMGRTAQVSIFEEASPIMSLAVNTIKTIGMFFIYGDANWRHNLSGTPQLVWPVGICFALGILFVLLKTIKKKDGEYKTNNSHFFETGVLVAWIGVAYLPVALSSEGIPHALRAILMIPPVYILAAIGADWVITRIQIITSKKIALAAVMLFGVSLSVQVFITYGYVWGGNPNTHNAFSAPYVQLGKTINELSPEIKKYIVINASGVMVRDIPMPSQTVMFITDSFTPEKQRQKNIVYLTDAKKIPSPTDGVVFFLEPQNNE